MKNLILSILAAVSLSWITNPAFAKQSDDPLVTQTRYLTEKVGDVEVFYREAGAKDSPVLLLLHGFPSSSHQFRKLIPLLADEYRVIAPDLPGFGRTVTPARGTFDYTFDNLTDTIDGFTEALKLDQFAMYVFDYGAPVGFRIAAEHPERVTAIISQNGNMYEEGLSQGFEPAKAYWANDTLENRNAMRSFLAKDTTVWQYTAGMPKDRANMISPDSIAHSQANIDRDPEIQLDLFKSYGSNVAAYPEWQAYLRKHQPPLLAIWGSKDPFFIPAGAEAFKRDAPKAQIEFIDTGHWALETHLHEVADRIRVFLGNI